MDNSSERTDHAQPQSQPQPQPQQATSASPPSSGAVSSNDDELLAGAIPIDQLEAASNDGQTPAVSDELEPIDLEAGEGDTPAGEPASSGSNAGSAQPARKRTIQAFGRGTRHEARWNRSPNSPGTGAIHVRTFVAKLRLDAVEHMDEQVNQWLDSHPQYEVKFVTKAVGKLKGKNEEEALFLSVWV